MLNFRFLEKIMGLVSPPHFVYDFFEKNISYVIYNLQTHQISMSGCLTSDIEKYMYCDYLFPAYDVIKFEINLSFLIKFFLQDQKVTTKS